MKNIITRISIGTSVALISVGNAFADLTPPTTGGSANGTGKAVGQGLIDLLSLMQTILGIAVPMLIGVAVVALFYGIVMFLVDKNNGNGDGAKKWSSFMGMAILALFVMVSVWGLVNFLGSLFGIGQGGSIPQPTIPGWKIGA